MGSRAQPRAQPDHYAVLPLRQRRLRGPAALSPPSAAHRRAARNGPTCSRVRRTSRFAQAAARPDRIGRYRSRHYSRWLVLADPRPIRNELDTRPRPLFNGTCVVRAGRTDAPVGMGPRARARWPSRLRAARAITHLGARPSRIRPGYQRACAEDPRRRSWNPELCARFGDWLRVRSAGARCAGPSRHGGGRSASGSRCRRRRAPPARRRASDVEGGHVPFGC